MKRKPKGAKYRNLTARTGVIYYQREIGSKWDGQCRAHRR